jgi:hypothetical protein
MALGDAVAVESGASATARCYHVTRHHHSILVLHTAAGNPNDGDNEEARLEFPDRQYPVGGITPPQGAIKKDGPFAA